MAVGLVTFLLEKSCPSSQVLMAAGASEFEAELQAEQQLSSSSNNCNGYSKKTSARAATSAAVASKVNLSSSLLLAFAKEVLKRVGPVSEVRWGSVVWEGE